MGNLFLTKNKMTEELQSQIAKLKEENAKLKEANAKMEEELQNRKFDPFHGKKIETVPFVDEEGEAMYYGHMKDGQKHGFGAEWIAYKDYGGKPGVTLGFYKNGKKHGRFFYMDPDGFFSEGNRDVGVLH